MLSVMIHFDVVVQLCNCLSLAYFVKTAVIFTLSRDVVSSLFLCSFLQDHETCKLIYSYINRDSVGETGLHTQITRHVDMKGAY